MGKIKPVRNKKGRIIGAKHVPNPPKHLKKVIRKLPEKLKEAIIKYES